MLVVVTDSASDDLFLRVVGWLVYLTSYLVIVPWLLSRGGGPQEQLYVVALKCLKAKLPGAASGAEHLEQKPC